jgi:hypothetical protein
MDSLAILNCRSRCSHHEWSRFSMLLPNVAVMKNALRHAAGK